VLLAEVVVGGLARALGLPVPELVLVIVQAAERLEKTCAGQGPAASTSLGQRFRWLTAPRSTVVHAGAVHGGLTADPETEVERLLDALVR
jgi:hypothetical protein